MLQLCVVVSVACSLGACSKSQPAPSDCDKLAAMTVKCSGPSKLSPADLELMRDTVRSVCQVKPDPTPGPGNAAVAGRAEIQSKKACAVTADDCAQYQTCVRAAGYK